MIKFRFHTVHEGVTRSYDVYGFTGRDAALTLRDMLYDGETIVGW